MTLRRLRMPVALLAAAALAGGCNDSPRIGDEEYIANAAETLLKMCSHGNGPGVYDVLAADTARRFLNAGGVLEGCQEVTHLGDPQEIPAPDLYRRARVADVEQLGDHAIVTLAVGERRTTVRMFDTGLEWLFSSAPLYELVGEEDLP